MPFTLTMPKLSPTMNEGTIAHWHRAEGDFVESGDVVMEVTTDKATVEYQAVDEGYLRKILVESGETAIVNQPVAIFTEEASGSLEGYEPEGTMPQKTEAIEEGGADESAAASPSPTQTSQAMAQPKFVPFPPLEDYQFPLPTAQRARIAASPLARQLAEQNRLDLSTVAGSGPGGRIVKRDLERAQSAGPVAFDRHEIPDETPGAYKEEPLTPMRKAIGTRLQEAKTFIPHFYVTQEVDAGELVKMRGQLKEFGVKISYNDFIVRAAALALRQKPALNTGFNSVNNSIIRFKTIDISIAVSMEGGLITPIVRHADYKSMGQISVEVKALAKRARAGKLKPEEYQGGSFTISNLGMFGISDFLAVINPPQSSILAVGGIREVPVVRNKAVVPGHVLKLSVACDHRVVDGADAADFLSVVKKCLENPSALLI